MEAMETKKIPSQRVIAMQHTGSHDEIGKVYHELREWARGKDVALTGPGFTVFLSPPSEFDAQSALFEVCLPVGPAVKGDAKVAVKEVPECTVAYATVTGPYDQIPAHYTEMLAWLSAQGMETAGPPREVCNHGVSSSTILRLGSVASQVSSRVSRFESFCAIASTEGYWS